MVWFARWRPKFKQVALCALVISALASAGPVIQQIKSYTRATTAYSEILKFDEVRVRTEASMKEVYGLLTEAAEMKTLAETLLKAGKTKTSKQQYQKLLAKYERVIQILTVPSESGDHIALAKNYILRIKEGLKDNNFFDENRVDIEKLERDIYDAWVEVDDLTKSVSRDFQEADKILATLK